MSAWIYPGWGGIRSDKSELNLLWSGFFVFSYAFRTIFLRITSYPPLIHHTSPKELLEICDAVICNSDYQVSLFETLDRLTKGFQKLPDPQLGQAAREWAVQNVSFETSISQLAALLKSFYWFASCGKNVRKNCG